MLLRALLLAYRRPPSCCVLTWQKIKQALCIYCINPTMKAPTLMASSKPNYLIKAQYHHSSHGGLGFQHISRSWGSEHNSTHNPWFFLLCSHTLPEVSSHLCDVYGLNFFVHAAQGLISFSTKFLITLESFLLELAVPGRFS